VAIAFGTVVYHYDASGRTLSETTATGALRAEYVYANGKLAAVVKPDGVYYYHTDPAGSPIAMTNKSNTVVWKADYRPFGEEQSKTLNFSNDRMFAGKERDRETGMYYFGARYMRPENGRFTTIDPIGPVDARTGKVNDKMLVNPQRLNRYAYALNNPYRYVDPDGKETVAIITRDRKMGIWYGSHSAVRIDNSIEGGPLLYDPAGSVYNPRDLFGGPVRGSDHTFRGKDADLAKYKASQEESGSRVELYRFKTTPAQERQISERIEKIGGQPAHLCTLSVSEAIQGIGPFKDMGLYLIPGRFADKLREVKRDTKQ
jgi:RHS repeat-associated protein